MLRTFWSNCSSIGAKRVCSPYFIAFFNWTVRGSYHTVSSTLILKRVELSTLFQHNIERSQVFVSIQSILQRKRNFSLMDYCFICLIILQCSEGEPVNADSLNAQEMDNYLRVKETFFDFLLRKNMVIGQEASPHFWRTGMCVSLSEKVNEF